MPSDIIPTETLPSLLLTREMLGIDYRWKQLLFHGSKFGPALRLTKHHIQRIPHAAGA
jgi:hypothetical protein